MRLRLSVIAILVTLSGADAETVNFTGTVSAVCALSAATDGALGIGTDGSELSSQAGGGSSGSITILSIGDSTIDVAAPTRTSAPVGYSSASETIEVAYQGLGGLSTVSQVFTDQASSFAVGSIAASVLLVDNRIVNPDGFAPGTYSTQTVITCGP